MSEYPLKFVTQPIYDTEGFFDSSLSELWFFQNCRGQSDKSYLIPSKSYNETNMMQCSMLPQPHEFRLTGFSIYYQNDLLRATLREHGVFEFFHLNQRKFVCPLIGFKNAGSDPSQSGKPEAEKVYNGMLAILAKFEYLMSQQEKPKVEKNEPVYSIDALIEKIGSVQKLPVVSGMLDKSEPETTLIDGSLGKTGYTSSVKVVDSKTEYQDLALTPEKDYCLIKPGEYFYGKISFPQIGAINPGVRAWVKVFLEGEFGSPE